MFIKELLAASALLILAQPVLSAAPAEKQAKQAKQDKRDPDAIRCKRIPVTGSLAQFTRECHSNAEWDRIAVESKRNASEMIGGSGACTGGPGCSGGN